MHILFFILSVVMVLLLIFLDFRKKVNLLNSALITLYLIVAPNIIVLGYTLFHAGIEHISERMTVLYLSTASLLIFYIWLKLNIAPVPKRKKTTMRLRIMIDGRYITYRALWAMFLEILFIVIGYRFFLGGGIPKDMLIANTIYAICIILFLFLNGILRMFFTSKRLGAVHRLIMIFTMWIPVVNLVVLGFACRLVYEEYDYALYKGNITQTRVDSDICKTRYPIIMLHGILFRDLRYFNYWGRIPSELIRYGATIYYGNQEAVGTIENNAKDIKATIQKVLSETGAKKVNLIAHSKGGLDARYTISMLDMDSYVASLTTMSTPHRGCRFVDNLATMPESLYRFIAKIVDNLFKKFGDENPDFYTATHQFTTECSIAFNKQVIDSPKVYYQSYMSKMKHRFSDPVLAFTYTLIKPLEGDNDGLVSTGSAIWGNFKNLFTPDKYKGISHGDIIDLKREDYNGFDVIESYVDIVSDLKSQGF